VSGVVVFSWVFAITVSLVMSARRSRIRDHAMREFVEELACDRRRALARRAEVERWNRRSIAVAGEFDA